MLSMKNLYVHVGHKIHHLQFCHKSVVSTIGAAPMCRYSDHCDFNSLLSSPDEQIQGLLEMEIPISHRS